MQTPIAFVVKQRDLTTNKELNDIITHGTHNGYVAVPEEHPLYGKVCADSEVVKLQVHGGVTYANSAIYGQKLDGVDIYVMPEYIGKINLLIQDGEFLHPTDKEFLMNELSSGKKWWIFGFDTWHFGDNPEDWDKETVISETQDLLQQLTEIVLK